ncbi:hypothetical protein DYB28_007542, partial [Aphanomyces astaci]
PAETMVTKPVSVTREVYTTMLLDKVIPAIKAKWPQGETKGVITQQDNTKPHDVDMMTLNANFLTLQCCMQEVMRVEGDNFYKIPHMKKAKLAAVGMLPKVVCVDRDLFDDGCRLLSATDTDKKIDELALEVAHAMDMSEFRSQMEKLSVDGELEDDIDMDLALLLGIEQLL